MHTHLCENAHFHINENEPNNQKGFNSHIKIYILVCKILSCLSETAAKLNAIGSIIHSSIF